jgi:crossover junction endodeoxyribonuclease RuvC
MEEKQAVNAVERIILGIDPGTVVMGYAVISAKGQRYTLISAGAIKFKGADPHFDRLHHIFEAVSGIIKNHTPGEIAIEEPFFGKNVQSMLKLGRAQGVAIAAALQHQLPVCGYSPRSVKQSITGRGAASKEQVAEMLQQLFGFEELPVHLDATDALAVALCHHFQTRRLHETPVADRKVIVSRIRKSYKGWDSFINDNPNRVK